jgi:hypothetical protein
MRQIFFLMTFLFVSVSALAGSGMLPPKGVKSVGSSMAFLDMCELAGYVPEGTTQRLQEAAQQGLARAYSGAVERQYRASLQEKMFYLVSRDQWLSFEVEPVACQQIAKNSESLIKNLEELAVLELD